MSVSIAVPQEFEEVLSGILYTPPLIKERGWVVYVTEQGITSARGLFAVAEYYKRGMASVLCLIERVHLHRRPVLRLVRSVEFTPDGTYVVTSKKYGDTYEISMLLDHMSATQGWSEDEYAARAALSFIDYMTYPNDQYAFGSRYLMKRLLQGED